MRSLLSWPVVALAAVLLAGVAAVVLYLALSDDSNAVTTMEISGELVEVEHLPYVRDAVAFPLPTAAVPEGLSEDEPAWIDGLGYFVRGLALPGGQFLIVTQPEPSTGERCLALVGDHAVIEASVCGGRPADRLRPLVLRSPTLLAVVNPPSAAVVAEFGGVYRTVEQRFVYFDDIAGAEGIVRYFDADGEQISADGAALPEDLALVGSQGLEALRDQSGADGAEPAAQGVAADVARNREKARIGDLDRWSLDVALDQRVGECMEDRGFDYAVTVTREPRPLLPKSDLLELFEYAAQLPPSSYAYRSAFGYGVSTLDAYTYVALGPALGSVISGGLTIEKHEAYNDALWGTESGVGCHELAADEIGYHTADDEQIELSIAHRLALQRANGLASHVAAEQRWAECAQEVGFGFAHPSEVPRHFEEMLFELPGEYGSGDGVLVDGHQGNEVLAGSQGGSDSIFDPVELALLQASEIDTALRLTRCDGALDEATRDTVNRLAEEILYGTPSGLGPDDGSPWSIGPAMPDDAVVQDLPHIEDDTVHEVSERLGRVEHSLTLPDGRQLVRTTGIGDTAGCVALIGVFFGCRGAGPEGWSEPYIQAVADLLVVTNMPHEAAVAEFGGVYRTIEAGLVYFDDIDPDERGGVRFYDADGRQISGLVRQP